MSIQDRAQKIGEAGSKIAKAGVKMTMGCCGIVMLIAIFLIVISLL